MRAWIAAAVLALLAAPAGAKDAPPAAKDWLRHIVSRCIDASPTDYCDRCLRPQPGRCGKTACADETVVWDESADFVAIRDRKMCGCGGGFVHGLALPRAPVAGVEDPRRPAGIWAFAWKAARGKIPDEDRILLAVNGPQRRSQDQLHVHLIRLARSGRERLAALDPEKVSRLDEIWPAAARSAARQGLRGWYGVAAARDASGKGFIVAADGEGHPETRFGVALCDERVR
ncbi:MAG TPA: CDP-diacylglycerol diphosphatase [Elusimicrobiota bacterium]|jgi:CDP-diacylglycerol pyrophosphatase|nr:CDP-diacylglycerol diphosphatase [Elusimicrobiota bacterium]